VILEEPKIYQNFVLITMCGILLGGFMTLKNYCDCSREMMETKWLKAQGRRFRKNGHLYVHL